MATRLAKPRKKLSPIFEFFKNGLVYFILLFGVIFTVLPFLWSILTSFKSPSEIIQIPPTFFPEQWTIKSYLTIFNDPKVPLLRFYFNSIFVTFSRVAITLFTSSFAGYIFAKFRFWGRDLAFALVMITLMIPFQIIMIPSYFNSGQIRPD